jgi:hypothetical protein
MRPAVARLVLFAVLFVIWLGYLFYLVQLGKPIVLSRPQFLVSQFDVIATAEGADRVKVTEVLSPQGDEADKLLARGELKVVNLDACKVAAPEGEKEAAFPEGQQGASYLLPLRQTSDGNYEVVRVETGARANPPRIYPDTKQVRAEYKRIRDALKPE